MATKDKKGAPEKGGKKQRKGGGDAQARGPHAGAHIPAPPPRLRGMYQEQIRPKLMQQFGLTNPHQVPTLEKIVLNVGVGEAIKQPKMLDKVVEELATITGQLPVRKKAKKSIANFGLRQGQEIEYIGLSGALEFDQRGIAPASTTRWWTIGQDGFTDVPERISCQ